MIVNLILHTYLGIRIQDIVQSLDLFSVRSTQGVFSTSCNYSDRPDYRANCLGTGSTGSFNKNVSSLSWRHSASARG